MSSYVALLRGVNVGRTKRMAMQELRDVLGAAGLTDVRTLLQSGNVIFEADSTETAKLAARLEEVIADGFAMEVPCVVCTASEMKRTISANPLPGRVTEGSKLLVTFLSRSLTAAQLAEHDPRALAPGDIHLGRKVLYQWCPNGVINAPPVVPFVERHFGVRATARNWSTLEKIVALLGS